MITAQETDVLLAITAAGASGGDWPVMLRALSRYLGADRARLWWQDQGWTDAGAVPPLRMALFTGLRPGRVYTGEELADSLLMPDQALAGTDHRLIGLRLPDGMAWVVISRNRGAFRAADSAALSALAPHLTQALVIAAQVAGKAQQMQMAVHLLRRLGVGVIRWDRQGRVTYCDSTASAILAELTTALPPPRGKTGWVQVQGSVDLMITTEPDGSQTGILRLGKQDLPAAAEIAALMGVTLPEARLIRALGQGDDLRMAAARLGITIETARYYSKQIFAKTGLRRQSDLMRRLWTSGLVFAEPMAQG
jgi:DNA-binding CsgD family transcriptional regulator/PAS domain-containing protein